VKYGAILLIVIIAIYFGYKLFGKKEGLMNPDIPSSGNALVYVFMQGCTFCDKQNLVFKNLNPVAIKDIKIIKLDGNENANFTKEHNIDGFPALLFFKNGKKVDSHSGFLDDAALTAKLAKVFA
jgi:thiol-disulfide isomerase/thioredoxin